MFKSGLGDLVCSADTSTHQMGPSGRGFAPAHSSDLYLEDFGITALTETPQTTPTPKPQLSSSFKPCSGRCPSQVEQLSPISVPRPSPAPCSPLHRPLSHQLCRQDQAHGTPFLQGSQQPRPLRLMPGSSTGPCAGEPGTSSTDASSSAKQWDKQGRALRAHQPVLLGWERTYLPIAQTEADF